MLGNGFLFGEETNLRFDFLGGENADVGELALYRKADKIIVLDDGKVVGHGTHEELLKLGGGLIFGDNTITVPKLKIQSNAPSLNGHNDHRIVMALSLILSKYGGAIDGAEAVRKSYPSFFDDINTLADEIESGIKILKDFGVTAIELGAQSTDEEVLRLNRRGHSRHYAAGTGCPRYAGPLRQGTGVFLVFPLLEHLL